MAPCSKIVVLVVYLVKISAPKNAIQVITDKRFWQPQIDNENVLIVDYAINLAPYTLNHIMKKT